MVSNTQIVVAIVHHVDPIRQISPHARVTYLLFHLSFWVFVVELILLLNDFKRKLGRGETYVLPSGF